MAIELLQPFSPGRFDALWEYARAHATEEDMKAISLADSHADPEEVLAQLRSALRRPLEQLDENAHWDLIVYDGPKFAWRYDSSATTHRRFVAIAVDMSIRLREFPKRGHIEQEMVMAATEFAEALGREETKALLEVLNGVLPARWGYMPHGSALILLSHLEMLTDPGRPISEIISRLDSTIRRELIVRDRELIPRDRDLIARDIEPKFELLEARDYFVLGEPHQWQRMLQRIAASPRRDFAAAMEQLLQMNALTARAP